METLIGEAGIILGNPSFTRITIVRRGKRREIAAPNEAMRELHQRVIARLNRTSNPHFFRNSYGLRGRSALENALAHLKNRYVYQIDITNAYPSVPLDRLADVLSELDGSLGDWREVLHFLEASCSGRGGGLAVGGPASPLLFDVYCAATIDTVVRQIVSDSTYTRYHDDLTISSPRPLPNILRRRIREAVSNAGFKISTKKTKYLDRSRSSITITGVTLTRRNRIKPKEDFVKKLTDVLKKPECSFTPSDAYSFRSRASHLLWFSHGEAQRVLSPEIEQLIARTRKRLKQLVARGLLPRVPHWIVRRYSPQFLDNLRQAIPIEEVIGRDLKLVRTGREYNARCPFHREQTPSFKVSPKKGFYHCFGCGAHGDVIEYLVETKSMSFLEAVQYLKERYPIPKAE